MQYLIDQARVFPARVAAHGMNLSALAGGHRPRALFVSCSDARVVPALLTGIQPGDLFELRTYGGLVPRRDTQALSGEARTIEYAVEELKVSDVIVCGHSRCDVASDAVRGAEALPVHDMSWPDDSALALAGDDTAAGQWHTLAQLDALSGYPSVIPRLADRTLRLHAWFYDVDTGAVFQYHPRASAFLAL
ncbi:carbonic anhydrase [Streptomyces phaeochromogenes]|uniref:carbonic anhydrase n=1 Tax=Streptomyces phaeochromogenes TaxID=1923 RepID=UPI0022588FC2|nr:carbonic anhydrase [Streptomyces phaeochromogenes]MCX5601255.1 carbonic anhydrase [Streptomyces phaeochromogenes]